MPGDKIERVMKLREETVVNTGGLVCSPKRTERKGKGEGEEKEKASDPTSPALAPAANNSNQQHQHQPYTVTKSPKDRI